VNLFNLPDFSFLDNPFFAAATGAFAALVLLGLFRRAKKIITIGVIGLTVTVGLIIWQFSG
jgi:hypothetical protein